MLINASGLARCKANMVCWTEILSFGLTFDAIVHSVSPGPVRPYSSSWVTTRSARPLLTGGAGGISRLLFEPLLGCADGVLPLDMPGSIFSIPSLLNTGGSSSTMYSLKIRPLGHIASTIKFRNGSIMGLLLVM